MIRLGVRHLTKSFGSARALDDVSFRMEGGTVCGLVGRNGAGKTTAIRIIMDIYRPDRGEILFCGEPRGADFYRRTGYLPEERGLYKSSTVLDNLLFLAEIKGVPPTLAKARTFQYLERLGLGERAHEKVESLSKGNQQKVQFIGTLLHDPQLVILDEPFSGLDPVTTTVLKEMILDLKRAGKLLILSTHMMEVAEKLCDRIVLIDKGKVLLDASPGEIKTRHADCTVSLQLESDADFLEALPCVTQAQRFGNSITVRMRAREDVQQLLRALVARNVSVRKFVANEASLHDVFVGLTDAAGEARPRTADDAERVKMRVES